MRFILPFFLLLLFACDNINSGWEIDGGGYVKYKLNGENAYENVEITNKNRMIAFSIGEKSFELTLVEKRKKG